MCANKGKRKVSFQKTFEYMLDEWFPVNIMLCKSLDRFLYDRDLRHQSKIIFMVLLDKKNSLKEMELTESVPVKTN